MWLWTATIALAAPCEQPLTRAELSARTAELEAALGNTPETTERLTQDAVLRLGCAPFVVRPSEVGAVFRGIGWAQWDQDAASESAGSWLAAAYGIQPGYTYDPTLVNESKVAWESAKVRWESHVERPLPVPAEGELFVNGAAAATTAEGLPLMLQHVAGDGTVLESWVVQPGDELPSYPTRPEPSSNSAQEASASAPRAPDERVRRRSRGYLLGGLGIAVLGGGSLAGSQVIQAQHNKQNATPQTIGTSRADRAVPYSVLAVGGWGLVGVGAVLSTVAVVKGEW